MNKGLCVLTVGIVSFQLQGCDYLYRLLDKEGAEEKEIIGEILPFEENSAIRDVQQMLSIFGYYHGKVDGKMGIRTRDALAAFQRENGLEESRFVDKASWQLLREWAASGLVKDSGLNIKHVQEILGSAGYNVGKIDGVAGPKTKAAVEAFQRDRGLKVDGKIGPETLKALVRAGK